MSLLQYLFDLVAVFNYFFNLVFGATPKITKLPKVVGVVTHDCEVSGAISFLKTFPDIEKVSFYYPSMKNADKTPLDLLIIHDPKASSNYLSIPDLVPRESLPYAELIPVTCIEDSALMRGLAAFGAKSQRFGR